MCAALKPAQERSFLPTRPWPTCSHGATAASWRLSGELSTPVGEEGSEHPARRCCRGGGASERCEGLMRCPCPGGEGQGRVAGPDTPGGRPAGNPPCGVTGGVNYRSAFWELTARGTCPARAAAVAACSHPCVQCRCLEPHGLLNAGWKAIEDPRGPVTPQEGEEAGSVGPRTPLTPRQGPGAQSCARSDCCSTDL